MAKKMLRKQRIAIRKLEERVLFDAAGAAEIVEAAAAADAASQGADAQDAQDSGDGSDEENGAVTAPPEDAAAHQEGAETEVQVSSGADAAENAVADDNPFDGSAALDDNTDLADALSDASDADTGADTDAADAAGADADTDTDAADTGTGTDTDAADTVAGTDAGDDASGVVFADAFVSRGEASPEAATRELVIISDSVKDQDEIIARLSDNTDVLVLKRGENPLDQINEYLDSREGVQYSAVHVVSHGNAGYFLLNDAIVDAQAVADDPASWKAIGEHLTSDGDILIYGCNVAGNEDGRAMIAGIADLTGADVAASADRVGATGGWELEYASGIVDTQNIVVDGVSWDMGSYTLVEEGATGGAGWTWGMADGDHGFDATGHLGTYKGGVFTADTGDIGNLTYCLTQAAGDKEASTIVVNHVNLADGTSANIDAITALVNAITDGGLEITGDAGTRITVGLNSTTYLSVFNSFTVSADVISIGNVQVNGGSLDLSASQPQGITFSKDVWAYSATLDFNAPQVRFTDGNWATFSGTSTLNMDGGTIDFDSTLTLNGNARLTLVNTSNADPLVVDLGGSVDIQAGAELSIGESTSVTFAPTTTTPVFTLDGTVSGAGTLFLQTPADPRLKLSGAGSIDMSDDGGTVVYGNGTDLCPYSDYIYRGRYGTLSLAGFGGGTLNYSDIFGDGSGVVPGNRTADVLRVNASELTFDAAVASGVKVADLDLAGNVRFGNAFLNSQNGVTAGGMVSGNVILGDAGYTYDGNVTLSGLAIVGPNRYVEARLSGNDALLTVDNTTFTGTGFQLRQAGAFGVEYADNSTIMPLYNADGTAQSDYTRLIISGTATVAASYSISVSEELVFKAAGAELDVYGNFALGSAAKPAAVSAADPSSSAIGAAGSGTVALYVVDGTVVPALYNLGSGTLTLTAGSNISIDGSILVSGGTTDITLGKGAVVNGDVLAYGTGVLTLTAGDMKLKGDGVGVEGSASVTLDFGTDENSGPSTITGETVYVDGANAKLVIAGNNIAVNGMVLVINGAELTVTGNKVFFQDDVLNYDVGKIEKGMKSGSGYKWVHQYLFSDADYYNYYIGIDVDVKVDEKTVKSPKSPELPRDPGTITIDSGSGSVDFNSLVVSGGTFDIKSGQVSFNSDFAVAGGTFSITGGTVLFTHDVYVSTVYGDGSSKATTTFSVTGGSVTVSGSLYNWVRIPVGYYSSSDSPLGYAGPFYKDTNDNNKIKLHYSRRTSEVIIGGDAQVAITGNVSNIGVWGEANFTINGSAQVTIGGNLAVYSESPLNFWSGSSVKYDYLTNLMGFSTGFTGTPSDRSTATYPVAPEALVFVKGERSAADFTIDGHGHLSVAGETWSGAMYGFNPDRTGGAWAKTTGTVGQGWTTFTVNSDGNVFKGLFTNSTNLYVNGRGNSFGEIDSNYFMYVNDTNTFGTITNYQDLRITNPGAVVLSLVNRKGNVWIAGDADKLTFANELTVDGGFVSIASELGTPITSPVSVMGGGELVFSAKNTLADTVTITSGKLTFSGKAGGSAVNGDVTIGEEGTLNISTEGAPVSFGNVANSGDFVVDGSISVNGKVVNSGKLSITKVSTFGGEGSLENDETGTVQVAADGTAFGAVTNAGLFTNAAGSVTYGGPFVNTESGTFVNNTGAEASFADAFTNSGTMKIDGTISVAGLFTNTSESVYVYGAADFGETVNSGVIFLEPLSGAHEAAVRFGDLTNDGTIASRNDGSHASDIYFAGKTKGSGSLEGFTGHLHYAYAGTEDITQTFYANSKYDQVTVSVGDKAANPGEVYSHGFVTLTEDLAFAKLIIDGGNLTIGDDSHALTLDTSSFVETNFGTVTVNAGSTLHFGAGATPLASKLDNRGLVQSDGDLVLTGATLGDGLVSLAQGKITYAYTGVDGQALYGFAEGSSTDLIIKGSTKFIAVNMTIDSLANEKIDGVSDGADILVKQGATFTLGQVTGYANEAADRFTVYTEDGGTLKFAAGTLNAAIGNSGSVVIEAAGSVDLGGTITTSGDFTVAAGAFAVAVAGTVGSTGSISAQVGEGGSLTFGSAVDNAGSFNAEADGSLTFGNTVSNSGSFAVEAGEGGSAAFNGAVTNAGGGVFTAADAVFNDAVTNSGRFTIAAVNAPVTVTGAVTNYGTFAVEGADGTNTVTFNGLVTNDVNGTLGAANASFAGGVAVASGEFRVGENVSWTDLANAGLVTVVSDLTVGSDNTISDNATGTIAVAGGAVLVFDAPSTTIGGTISVDAGATLSVEAAGTVDDPGTGVANITTTGGVTLTGLLINRGTVSVSGIGSGSVLDVAVFDNGDADSASTLDIGEKSSAVVRRSAYRDGSGNLVDYVDENNDPVINGNILLDPDGHLYFDGGVSFLAISVTVDGKLLSEFQNIVTNPQYKTVGIQISKTGAEDVAFTVDVDSDARISYTVLNGATLVLDVDETLQSGLPLTVAGGVSADAGSTVRNDTVDAELAGSVNIAGTLENADGNTLAVSGDNAVIGNAVNGTGSFTVSGAGSTVGTVSNDTGSFTASDGAVIGEVTANGGTITAGDIAAVSANEGTITASGDVGSVGTNSGDITVAGDVGDVTENTAGASITAAGSMGDLGTNAGTVSAASVGDIDANSGVITATTGDAGDIGTNSGTITVAANVGDVTENTADGIITADGDMGDVGTNGGEITVAGDMGDIGSNAGTVSAASAGDIGANSGAITVEGNVGNVTENTSDGSILAGGSVGNVGSNAGDILAVTGSVGDIGSNDGTVIATLGGAGDIGTNSGTIAVAGSVGNVTGNTGNAVIVAGGDMGNVGTNAGSIAVAGDMGDITENVSGGAIAAGGSIGDIESNSGDITQTGDGATIGNIASNSGSITIDGSDVEVGNVANASDGAITVNGDDVEFEKVSNAGTVTVNGKDVAFEKVSNTGAIAVNGKDAEFDELDNSGSVTVEGDNAEFEKVANSGDFLLAGDNAEFEKVANSGSFSVTGDASRLEAVSNSGSFSVTGDANAIGSMANSGDFSFTSSNDPGNITNTGTGTVERDGVIWMMASDEGMNPDLFSDGMNPNFSVLAYLTENILSDSALTGDDFSGMQRIGVGSFGRMPAAQASPDAVGVRGVDLLGIDDDVDEIIFGDSPAMTGEELDDVLSGDGEDAGFEAAINEVVGK